MYLKKLSIYNISDTFLFVFVSRRGVSVTQVGLKPSAILWTFQVLGLKMLATIASSDIFMFLTLLSGEIKAKILGTVELLLRCVEETVDYEDHRSKVSESGQGKERGETVRSGDKRHWGRDRGLPGHKGYGNHNHLQCSRDPGLGCTPILHVTVSPLDCLTFLVLHSLAMLECSLQLNIPEDFHLSARLCIKVKLLRD